MENIFEMSRFKKFTISQANQLLPLVYKITQQAAGDVRSLINRLEAYPDKKDDRAMLVENEINQKIEVWQNKVEKLGAKPKGMWLVDFDNGDGYFCWKYPETEVLYHHGYQDGYSGRKIISDENSNSPDQPYFS